MSYFKVERFMTEKLNLSGNELLVFAIIHGFTSSAQGRKQFDGSMRTLELIAHISHDTCSRILKKLVDKNFIHKTRTKSGCIYCSTVPGSSPNLLPVLSDNRTEISTDVGHNNKINNKNNTRPIRSRALDDSRKQKNKTFAEEFYSDAPKKCPSCGGPLYPNGCRGVQCNKCKILFEKEDGIWQRIC